MKILFSVIIIFFDQLTKFIIYKNIPVNNSVTVLSFLDIVHVKNTGISFGLLANSGYSSIISLLVAFIVVFQIFWFFSTNNNIEKWGLLIIISGGFGNLIDRIIRQYVIDFIYFNYNSYYWPAFNIADIAITIGFIIIIFGNYRKKNIE